MTMTTATQQLQNDDQLFFFASVTANFHIVHFIAFDVMELFDGQAMKINFHMDKILRMKSGVIQV